MNTVSKAPTAVFPQPGPPTARSALRRAEDFLDGLGVARARLDAEVLLCHALGCSREKLYCDMEAILSEEARERFVALLRRRAQREPLAYITASKEFWSLDFHVTSQVLVPRPETELVVETALGLLEKESSFDRILDIGTGSGAIAVSLAKERDRAEIWATDLSGAALEVARANACRHDVETRIRFLQGNLFAPVRSWGSDFFDLIVSNPPYVRRGEIEGLAPEVRDWEPRLALDGGEDGLDFYRRILAEGHLFLTRRGRMALEIGADSACEVARLAEACGAYRLKTVGRDYGGMKRVVVLQKRP
jgi:release factor glutamine methyltransferase